jgi:transcriptional regulator with XRE-family HTH domain
MTLDDKAFFISLGKQVSLLRKESGFTQAQLAEFLEISQQMIAAYEAGTRKIPASMLPKIAKLFAVSIEQLTGVEPQPVKRGPASTLQRQIEQISLMPRGKQKFISEMLDALIKQQQSA